MKFCPKCGTRLKLKQVKGAREVSVTYNCDNCGYSKKEENALVQKTEEELSNTPQIKIVGEKEEKLNSLPTTKMECPKCGHNEAFWWFLQTRSGDEPPTQFYRCVKCSHTWRSYS
ncbi:MAG: transcription factor S [Nitrososphaerota archaeon]|nr:transcription factor S [Nitrososphaerota archaeon]MDG6956510.1 transcription factor S [Nitrososphaerota archaeon]MDG6957294.1 transcription factor S [Nitrososphaerota archaeon]MDG6960086.1 transcription factor S [Nitrososphaerota archaeon]MDG6965500.1 transcription factor S [Nitrososphaerota archaeon]